MLLETALRSLYFDNNASWNAVVEGSMINSFDERFTSVKVPQLSFSQTPQFVGNYRYC